MILLLNWYFVAFCLLMIITVSSNKKKLMIIYAFLKDFIWNHPLLWINFILTIQNFNLIHFKLC